MNQPNLVLRQIFVLALILTASMAVTLRANFLDNSDFKEDMSSWHGDGSAAFLKPDGTEGDESDPGVIPVIKLKTSPGETRLVYQEFETPDKPTTLHVKVDVFASADFKRSAHASDYTINWKAGGTWYWSAIAIPNVDFWIRGGGSSWFYKLANLKPGTWTTVDGRFEGLPEDQDRVVNFCIPCGEGTVYHKNPVVEP